MRLDIFLAENGLVRSRSKAKELIESGNVTVKGTIITKPSFVVENIDISEIDIKLTEKYVSRGGLKLEGIIDAFGIDVSGAVCVDIGASTGGFTDCLLQNGAQKVYAFDSGAGQLAPSIAANPAVISKEKFNARNICRNDIENTEADIVVMDVSFISQTYIIPNIPSLLCDGGIFISLIKPQFEAGQSAIGKGGLVRSVSDRKRSVERVVDCAVSYGLVPMGLMESPIEGGDGNIEFLAYFVKSDTLQPAVTASAIDDFFKNSRVFLKR